MVIMDTYDSSPKIRITGALMQNFVQKPATLMGEVIKLESDGKRATVKTTDDQFVQVVFTQPLSEPLQLQTLTELYGIVLSRSQFQCHRVKQFTADLKEEPEKFDKELYNEFVAEFVKNCDQHINCLVESNEDESVIVPIDNFSLPSEDNSSNNHDMSFN